jgi:hypothetical protein
MTDAIGNLLNGWDRRAERSAEHGARFGDVICSSRGLYWHYGVYASDDEVIHYTSEDDDKSATSLIMATPIRHFLRGDPAYYVVNFDEAKERMLAAYTAPAEALDRSAPASAPAPARKLEKARAPQRVIHTPEQTVARARSRLREQAYDLPVNNCEHFAMWCKTGLVESSQIDALLQLFQGAPGASFRYGRI